MNGNTINGDGSAESPWGTLQSVGEAGKFNGTIIKSGDTVKLLTGFHGHFGSKFGFSPFTKINTDYIIIEANDGAVPDLNFIGMSGCNYWHFKNLRVSPEFSNQVVSNRYSDPYDGRCSIVNFYYLCRYVKIEDCNIFTVADTSAWTPQDWNSLAYNGLRECPRDSWIHGCLIKNVKAALMLSGQDTTIEQCTIKNFCTDGIFIASGPNITIQDNNILDAYDDVNNETISHSDFIQGSAGLTDAQCTNWIIRRNYCNVRTDPNRNFNSMEATICQGFYIDKMIDGLIENNVVMPDNFWGITLNSHGENVKIINNTVLMTYGATYSIKAQIHFFNWAGNGGSIDGYGFSNVLVRNNIAHGFTMDNFSTSLSSTPPPPLLCDNWDDVVIDHNFDMDNYNPNVEFVDYAHADLRLRAGSHFINAGSEANAPISDILGNSRSFPPDAGCYEYVSLLNADAGRDQNSTGQVTLNGSGSSDPNGSIVSYIWSEGGSQIATGVKPPPVTLSVGRHTIKLTVTDNSGNKSSDTLTVTVQLEDGLVKYFKFNEGSGTIAGDFTQIGDPGHLINGPAWTAQGEISFDGDNDTVEITTADVNVNRGTIALWAYPNAFSKNKHSLFGHVLSQSNRIQLYCNATGSLNVGLGDNAAISTNIQNLNAHEWYHIALVWDQINYKVYVDGSQKAAGTYSGLSSLQTYADIGNSGNLSARTEGFDGLIDEVRLYNKPLSDDEIAEIALVFLPIDDKTMSAGEELSFTVRTKPGSNVEISDTNLPTTPYFASNLFRWTSDYNDSGVYEVNFIAPHGLSTDREDFEKIAIYVTNTSSPYTNSMPPSSWDNGSGDIYYNLNGNLYIWDLSGSYSYKAGEWQLDYTLIQDASGKITGTGTASNSAVNSGAAVPITLKGAISGAAAVKMTLKGTSVKGRIKGTVNGGSKAISGTAKINRQIAPFTAPLPANMDGSATLGLSCTSSGNSRFGTGEQTLSNGESFNFGIKGKYNAKSDESTLTLKGSAKGSSLKLKVNGSNGTIKILKGKVLGQKLNATNIAP